MNLIINFIIALKTIYRKGLSFLLPESVLAYYTPKPFRAIYVIEDEFMVSYDPLTTLDVVVDDYFTELYTVWKGAYSHGTTYTFKFSDDNSSVTYTLYTTFSPPPAIRKALYTSIYLEFMATYYVIFLKSLEKQCFCFTFTICFDSKDGVDSPGYVAINYLIKRKRIDDSDFFNMALSFEQTLLELKDKYQVTYWHSISITIS